MLGVLHEEAWVESLTLQIFANYGIVQCNMQVQYMQVQYAGVYILRYVLMSVLHSGTFSPHTHIYTQTYKHNIFD